MCKILIFFLIFLCFSFSICLFLELEFGRIFQLYFENIPYIATRAAKLDQLHNHPRFIAILEKMNLPLPED